MKEKNTLDTAAPASHTMAETPELCGASSAASCVATVVPAIVLSAILALRLLLWLFVPHDSSLLGAKPPRLMPIFFMLSMLVGLGLIAAALLVEPWLDDVEAIGTWPPPAPGIIAASLWGCYSLFVPWVASAEVRTGRARVASCSLVLACVLRLVPLVVGLANPNVRTAPPFLIAEILTLAASACAAAMAIGCCVRARPEPLLLADGLQPLAATSTDQLRLAINQEADVSRSRRGLAEEDDAASERVVPSGASCCEAIGHFHSSHKQMIEEAKAIQRGEPYPPKPKQPRPRHSAEEETAMREVADKAGNGSGSSSGSGEGEGEGAAPKTPSPPEVSPMTVLRRHLWKYCPKPPLCFGMACSVVLTSTSFAAPYVQGRLFDAAVNAAHAKKDVELAFREEVGPLLGVLGALCAAASSNRPPVRAIARLSALFHGLPQHATAFRGPLQPSTTFRSLLQPATACHSLPQPTTAVRTH